MPVALGAGAPQALRGVSERHLGAVQLLATRTSLGGVGEHIRDRAAVLADQPLGCGQALFDLIQRAVLTGEPFAVVAQLRGEVAGLQHDRAHPLGERIQVGVDTGDRV